MGTEKVRRAFYVRGALTVGGTATLGGDLAATGNVTATGGTVTLGADVALVREGANVLGLAASDSLNLSSRALRVPAGTAALGTANLATANAGDVRVGYNGATVQLGWVCNGTVYIASGTAGGALSLGTAG